MGNLCCCFCSQQQNTLQPFFEGQIISQRMIQIRKNYIQPIRQQYSRPTFISFIKKLQKQFEKDQEILNLIDNISYRYWDSLIKKQKVDNFQLIKFYTHHRGYKKCVGKLISSVLRQKILPQRQKIQLAVYFVEAINIQLFLLIQSKPNLKNYQGKVYRGITSTKTDFQKFQRLMDEKNHQQKIFGVPLSLWSASKQRKKAQQFIKPEDNQVGILLIINIINLEKDSLKCYQQKFPESVVSTICAVDISRYQSLTTYFPQQKQVLLRGAFCLLLDIRYNELKKYYEIQCVMVNSNRDHISTNNLGDKADEARKIFASINKQARSKFALQYVNPLLQKKQNKSQVNDSTRLDSSENSSQQYNLTRFKRFKLIYQAQKQYLQKIKQSIHIY